MLLRICHNCGLLGSLHGKIAKNSYRDKDIEPPAPIPDMYRPKTEGGKVQGAWVHGKEIEKPPVAALGEKKKEQIFDR